MRDLPVDEAGGGRQNTNASGTFYPPEPPKPRELPTDEDSASLIDRCTLAGIKVDLGVDGSEKLRRSVPKIQAEFTKRMGNPDPQLAPFGYPLGSP